MNGSLVFSKKKINCEHLWTISFTHIQDIPTPSRFLFSTVPRRCVPVCPYLLQQWVGSHGLVPNRGGVPVSPSLGQCYI